RPAFRCFEAPGSLSSAALAPHLLRRRAPSRKNVRKVLFSLAVRPCGPMVWDRHDVSGVRRMERVAGGGQTVVLDGALPALAFAVAFFVAPTQPELGFGQAGAMSFFQLAALYAAIAGIFALIFRRELSPWRYVSIPDALVLARSALLTVGVFLLACFVLDRA